jgi:hypothetical protein
MLQRPSVSIFNMGTCAPHSNKISTLSIHKVYVVIVGFSYSLILFSSLDYSWIDILFFLFFLCISSDG